MIAFREFPKIPRLNREIVVTEKIDGTNAAVVIEQLPAFDQANPHLQVERDGLFYEVCFQSRSKLITPEYDNHGFARWAHQNVHEILALGPGSHFGEWWGQGINKRYPGAPKRFSLFNVSRWGDAATRPAICDVVPTLYRGPFDMETIRQEVDNLRANGSGVWPGAKAEGVVVWHSAASQLFKVTCEKDDQWKGAAS